MLKVYICEISNLIKKMPGAEDKARSYAASNLLLFAMNETGHTYGTLPKIAYEHGGKPYFREKADIHFNLSHSKNIVLCAISDKNVGADIERVRKISKAAIQRVFSEKEQEYVYDESVKENGEMKEENTDLKKEGCIRLWTMKEAFSKLRGIGIGDILDGMEITKEKGKFCLRKIKPDKEGIKKTSCCIVSAEGKIFDSCGNTYFYSVCTKESESPETVYVRWEQDDVLHVC